MLIIPLTRKISKQNPPLVTIAIILINCFVYFFLQADDEKQYRKAMTYYFDSGLAKMETSRYLSYLESEGDWEFVSVFNNKDRLSENELVKIWRKMQKDDVFIKKLRDGEVITSGEEIYAQWKALRIRYETELSNIVGNLYGFKPAERNFFTAFTYMFLHGGFMHLLGNMIFLWLVGCVIELGCGRAVYILIYLITGIASAWLFSLVNLDSTMPLVGASGAISGLMGTYTVLYGKRRIKIFYSLAFYFNYTKVPAIILLPVWLGNELFQLFFGDLQHVAYMAHIGGLTSGALLGYLNQKFIGMVDQEVFQEDPTERIAPLLEEALGRIGKLDMDEARPLLEQVLEIDPDNRDALIHLFNVEKLNPESERFHKAASNLFLHFSNDKICYEDMYKTYKEYRSISKQIRLSLELLLTINSILCAQGHPEESEKILAAILRTHPKLRQIPKGIVTLAQAYLKKGMEKKGKKCLLIICQKYPQTPEAQIARRLLESA
jgi:membrane associated rhomboid family serine protease